MINQENTRIEYSFNASGTIVEWLIVGFSIYGFYCFVIEILELIK